MPLPTLSDIEDVVYALTNDVHASFSGDEVGHQFINDGFRSDTERHIRQVIDRYEDESEDDEVGVYTVHAIAKSVREHVGMMVAAPGEYAFEEGRASDAAKVVGENYESVSAAYEQYGGGGDGLDGSLLAAVNAYYRQCANEVGKHWDNRADDFYYAIRDLL